MLLRIFGALLLLSSSLALSKTVNSRCERQSAELSGFLSLLRRIRLEIDCFKRPLPEIYSGFSDPALDRLGFSEKLRAVGFEAALASVDGKIALDSAQFSLLSAFAGKLGRGYTETELSECDYYIDLLARECESLSSALPEKSRLCRSLCLLSGVSAVIILF